MHTLTFVFIATAACAFPFAQIRAGKPNDAVTSPSSAAVISNTQQPTETKTMSDTELKKKLTPEQYRVTRENGTEPPFHNEYWNNHAPGIYVDLISGEPLFSSTDKFESGSGWPSFTKPIDKNNVVEKTDRSLFMSRTEVRSKKDDAHLGHVFDDGPAPTGMRYCMNSAALRFVPVEKMKEEGYGQYLYLFDKPADDATEKNSSLGPNEKRDGKSPANKRREIAVDGPRMPLYIFPPRPN